MRGKKHLKIRTIIRRLFSGRSILSSLFNGFIIAGLFSFVLYAFATPPDSPYAPGATLTPSCSPGSTNCTVTTPAVSGANSDITSLSGLTTPLSSDQGGTGLDTIAAGSILGANTLDTLSVITSTSGTKYLQNASGTISWSTIDYQPLDTGLTSLAGLTYVSTSFVKMTGADTFALDTNTYYKSGDAITTSNLTDSGLTITRVPYASTGGLLVDSANLTFDGTTLTAGGLTTTGTGTFGIGRFTTGIYDNAETPLLSIDAGNRRLKDGQYTSIYWGLRRLSDATESMSLEWGTRQLYASDESIILNWATAGTANFQANAITTTGTISGGAITGTSLIATSATGLTLGTDVAGGTTNIPGFLKLFSNGDNAYYTTFIAGTQTANAAYILPTAAGTNGQSLTWTTGGQLAWATVATAPGGANTQVQYNNNGAFAGSANLTFDGTTLTAGGFTTTGTATIGGAANVVQATITANASQTADLFQIKNSTGTVITKAEDDGIWYQPIVYITSDTKMGEDILAGIGAMSSGTGWNTAGAFQVTISGGTMNYVDGYGAYSGYIYTTGSHTLLANRTYKVTVDVKSETGDVNFRIGAGPNVSSDFTSVGDAQVGYIRVTENYTDTLEFSFSLTSAMSVDNVTIEPVGGDLWVDYLHLANDLMPSADNTINLGSVDLSFKDAYIDGTLYIEGGAATLSSSLFSVNGTLRGNNVQLGGTSEATSEFYASNLGYTKHQTDAWGTYWGKDNDALRAYNGTNLSDYLITGDYDILADVNIIGNTHGADLIVNGTFAADSDWTKNGWTISTGKARHAIGGGTGALVQAVSTITAGETYILTFKYTTTNDWALFYVSAGGWTSTVIDGTSTETTYTYIFTASNTNALSFYPGSSSHAATIDDVVLKKLSGGNLNIAGSINIAADNTKSTWGTAGATDSYIQWDGAELDIYANGQVNFGSSNLTTTGTVSSGKVISAFTTASAADNTLISGTLTDAQNYDVNGTITQKGLYQDIDISGTVGASQSATKAVLGQDIDIDITGTASTVPNYDVYGQRGDILLNPTDSCEGQSTVDLYGLDYDITTKDIAGGGVSSNYVYGTRFNVNGNQGTQANYTSQKYGHHVTVSGTGDANYGLYISASGATLNYDIYLAGGKNIITNNGALTLGSVGATNNENLTLDFQTTANTIEIGTGTGVTAVDFNALDLKTDSITTSTIIDQFGYTMESSVSDGGWIVPAGTTFSTYGTLYAMGVLEVYGKASFYGGVDPPYVLYDAETRESILERVNRDVKEEKRPGLVMFYNVDTDQMELYSPTRDDFRSFGGAIISEGGIVGTGEITGVESSSVGGTVRNILASFGIAVEKGITSIKELVTERFSVKTARIEKMEMVDSATGDVWCTWIENGEWQKTRGECAAIAVTEVTPEPIPTPEPTPTPEPEVAPEPTPEVQPETQPEQIETEQIKEEVKEEVKQELKDELKQEVKQELKGDIKTEVKKEVGKQTAETTDVVSGLEQELGKVKEQMSQMSQTQEEAQPEVTPTPEEQPIEEVQPIEEIQPEVVPTIEEAAPAGLLQKMWDSIKKLVPSIKEDASASLLQKMFNSFKKFMPNIKNETIPVTSSVLQGVGESLKTVGSYLNPVEPARMLGDYVRGLWVKVWGRMGGIF